MPPVPKPETAPETRRGLTVKRPKGKPFTYTVETRGRRPPGFHMRIFPDGIASYAPITVTAYNDKGGPAGAVVWHTAESYYTRGLHRDLSVAENFAAALRWAVSYALRWNARHGLGQEGEGGG